MVTTNVEKFAHKLKLIRNHAEAVIDGNGQEDLINCVGFNLRFTEIAAIIASEQLKKLPNLLDQRIENANFLSKELSSLPGIEGTFVKKNCKHVYYVQPMLFDENIVGVKRDVFISAVQKELPKAEDRPDGELLSTGFAKPIYLLPLFQKLIVLR